jgi:hypothetical protein
MSRPQSVINDVRAIVEKPKKAKSVKKNGRYAASKAGSVLGFLLNGKPKIDVFDTLSEVEDVLSGTEPYIRPQD